MTRYLLIAALSLCSGAYLFWEPRRGWDPRQDTRDTVVQLGLDVGPEVQQYLNAHMARRNFWGRVGGAIAGVTFFPGVALLWPRSLGAFVGLLAVVVAFLGHSLGMALSANSSARVAADQPRVASLRPHGLRGYLTSTAIAFEMLVTGSGVVVSVLGVCRLLGYGSHQGGLALVCAGVMLGVMPGGILALQWRLVRLPRQVGSPAQAMANDIVRTVALHDLVTPVRLIASLGAALVAMGMGATMGWALLVCYAVLGIGALAVRPLRRGAAPVAQQIARRGAFV